jgi:hypothetical protein
LPLDIAAAVNPGQPGEGIVAARNGHLLTGLDPCEQLGEVGLGFTDLHPDGHLFGSLWLPPVQALWQSSCRPVLCMTGGDFS